jgi:hypothetical protein
MGRFLSTVVMFAMLLSSAPQALAERYALLVGISEYPGLGKDLQLNGPQNDIPAMRALLTQRGFDSRNVEILADGVQGAGVPTRQAIMAALDGVVARAHSGDYVYLHFAGHGSQQPARDPKLKPDGLSEIFLPRDVGRWDGTVGTVHNAIVDEELVQRLDALLAKGAFVWAVFDACHSATLMRGGVSIGDGIRYRKVDPAALGVPSAALEQAAANAPRTRGAAEPKVPLAGLAPKSGPGRFVAFYAAQTTETTPEMRLPAGHPDRKPMGLFSFTLGQALATLPDGITYRQLAQHVLARYAEQNFNSPTPLFTGSLDAPVFGSEPRARVWQWPIRSGLAIDAGALNGLTDSALLAILPGPLAKSEEALGYARVASVDVFSAKLKPVEHGGKPALPQAKVPSDAFARLLEPAVSFALTVSGPIDAKGATVSDAAATKAIATVQAQKDLRVQWLGGRSDPDLRLVVLGGQLWLVPRGAMLVKEGPLKTHSIVLNQEEAQLARKIADSLRAIGKLTALQRLATAVSSGAASQNLEVGLELSRDGKKRRISREAVPVLKKGDVISAQVMNKGRSAVDVTILYVNSDYGIQAVYPRSIGSANRVAAGGKINETLGEITDDTLGTERLIVIAVESRRNEESYDFSFLEQASLERTRGARGDDAIIGAFMDAGYRAATRGLSAAVPSRVAMQAFAWRVERSNENKR